MTVFQKVRGWIGLLFSIGIDGPQIAWDSAADASADRAKILRGDQSVQTSVVYSKLAGADPTAAQDFVTKTYGDTTYATTSSTGHMRTIEIPIGFGDAGTTQSSTAIPPTTAKVISVKIRVDTTFDGTTPTVTVGGATTGAAAFAATADSDLTKLGTYELPQYTELAAAEVVGAVLSAMTGATQGVAVILIAYTVPDA